MKACQEFGLSGGLLLTIIITGMAMGGFGFKWILEQFNIELEGARKERTDYLNILNNMNRSITEHNERSKEFCDHVAQEHKEMIATLGRINGYKE